MTKPNVPRPPLSEADREKIRTLYTVHKVTLKNLAARFDVSTTLITKALR